MLWDILKVSFAGVSIRGQILRLRRRTPPNGSEFSGEKTRGRRRSKRSRREQTPKRSKR